MSAVTRKTIHTTFRARAIDDVQSPEPDALCLKKGDVVVVTEIEAVGRAYGARYDGKRGWFPLDQVIDEPPSSPRSPRSGSSISPRSLSSSGSSVSTSPGGSSGVLHTSGSGISREAPSPTSTRNQPKPAARKISSFLWKTREERQNEILGGGAVAAALASIAQEEQLQNQNQGLVEEKSLKKPSDIIKLRLMRRKSVSDKPIAAAAQRRSEFGVTIEELAGRDSAVRGLPYVVFVSVAHLIEHALDLEGIFRISVSYPDLLEMKDMLETGLPRLLDSQASCHAVAATLKQFFRELPDPLLTFALYDKWMNTGELQNLDERKQKLIALIKELPEANQRTLHFLMTFLKVVSLHSEVNKMSTLNLGVVFAPSILRRKVETKDDFMRMETQRGIVETFLDDYEEVFPQLFPQGQKEANQGSWTEERLLDLLRPTEKETAQLRRVSGGSAISGTVQKEESPSEAYIREHSPGAASSGSGADSRMLSSMDQLSPVQPSSPLKENYLAAPGAKEGSSDSEGEEEKKESKKKSRSRGNTTDKSRKEEREKRKREKAERKEEKRKEKEKDKDKEKEKKEKDKSEKKEKNKGKDKDKENKDTDKDQTKDREKDKDNDESKDEGSKKRGSVVFMKEAPPARAVVTSSPVRRSESPKEMRRRAVTASGSFLSPVENGSDMRKRSMGDSTDALSLSRSDEKDLSAHLEALRNESRAIELEIENKRLEWTWLEQEKKKLSEAVAALNAELDMKRKERAMLEEENKKLKSKNEALIVSEVYSSDEEDA